MRMNAWSISRTLDIFKLKEDEVTWANPYLIGLFFSPQYTSSSSNYNMLNLIVWEFTLLGIIRYPPPLKSTYFLNIVFPK